MMKKVVILVLSTLILSILGGCQIGPTGPTPTESPVATVAAKGAPVHTPAATPTPRPNLTVTPQPTFTPSMIDDLLARAAVDGFLSALVRGDLQQAMELWFTTQAREEQEPTLLEHFGGPTVPQFTSYEVIQKGWQEGGTYQARAAVEQASATGGQGGVQELVLQVVQEHGLWLIGKVSLGEYRARATAIIPTAGAGATPAKASVAPKPTATPTPGLSGKLAFMTSPGGPIYVINADGSGLRHVVDGMDPALSPDGTQIAYARWVDPRGIWVANVDGSDQRHYYLSSSARGPAWSPDGKHIAFWQYKWGPVNPEHKCWNFFNNDGTPKEGSPPIPADAWDVEEKQTRICWTVPPDPHYQLAVINLPAGDSSEWTSDWYSHGPTWSPDGKAVAYEAEKGLALNVIDGGRLWLSDKVEDAMPAWSPDGKYIAFQYWSHDHWEILRMNADGSGRVALAKNTPLADRAENSTSPAWSPDSQHIAFVTDRRGRWEVWVMNADGSDQHPMFGDGLPGGVSITYENVRERMLSWSR
jgi:TolB protein